MTPEIQNLLSVLDMTEMEQFQYIHKLYPITHEICSSVERRKRALADLAFRSRDEAVKKDITKYIDAENMVKSYVLLQTRKELIWNYHSKPIHWIICSLIAMILAGKK